MQDRTSLDTFINLSTRGMCHLKAEYCNMHAYHYANFLPFQSVKYFCTSEISYIVMGHFQYLNQSPAISLKFVVSEEVFIQGWFIVSKRITFISYLGLIACEKTNITRHLEDPVSVTIRCPFNYLDVLVSEILAVCSWSTKI